MWVKIVAGLSGSNSENQFDVKIQAAGWSSVRGKACYCRVTIDDDLEDEARECLEQVQCGMMPAFEMKTRPKDQNRILSEKTETSLRDLVGRVIDIILTDMNSMS